MTRASRRSTRSIQGREGAEEAFGMPVVAEIPRAVSHGVDGLPEVEVSSRPDSASSLVYRRLAARIDHALHQRRDPNDGELEPRAGSTVLITSARDEPARSFAAVNLAAVFADAGDRVIVATTRGFGEQSAVPTEPQANVSGVRPDRSGLASAAPSSIVARARPSWLPGVSSLALGELIPAGSNPTDFGPFIEAAREVVNYLVLEVPLLALAQGKALLSCADLVVVVCESGRTSAQDGSECASLLSALPHQKVLGLVLANPSG